MDVFALRALTSYRFVRRVADFIGKQIFEQPEKREIGEPRYLSTRAPHCGVQVDRYLGSPFSDDDGGVSAKWRLAETPPSSSELSADFSNYGTIKDERT